MVVNLELNEEEEPGCIAVLADKKYFHVGQSFLKRTVREGEWPTSRSGRAIVPSPSYEHRWNNDAETLMFLRKHTNIPLPAYQCIFKDAGALYLFTEYVDGVSMDELSLTQQEIVMREVEEHVATLHSLRSKTPGG
ncbi:MAG: hypothetical protein M4579_006375 [Chaenotheca gracillima]|nr:MAG: hypothetical protein M4579_006375 [Chaenotheca gracillima]